MSERPHADRCGDGDVAAATARGVGGVARHRSPSTHRVGEFGLTGSAADREPFLQHRQNRSSGVADVDGDRDDPTDLGIDGHRRCCGDDQARRLPRQWLEQPGRVIEVHQAQQAFDDRETGSGGRCTDGGEHRRPAAADQRVGNRREGGSQWGAECRGDAGVISNPFGIPLHSDGGRTADEFRKLIRSVDTRRDGQHRAHGCSGVGGEDHRRSAVDHGRRQGEGDVDPGARQRNAQNHPVGCHHLKPSSGGMICRAEEFTCGSAPGVMHLPLRWRGQPVHRIDGGAPGPQHVRGVQHDAERTGDVGPNLQP